MNWQRAGDLGLWSSLALFVIIESGARSDPYWMQAIFLAVLAAAVLLRRSWPIIGLSLVIATQVVIIAVSLDTTNGVQIALIPAISALSYLSGRRETQLRHFVLMASGELVGLLVLAFLFHPEVSAGEVILNWLVILLLSLLLVVMPWLIGRYRAQQALLASAGWDRAERIERQHRLEIDQERLRERSRIAEDMHDSVGHELSLIALRAAALEVDTDLPERHRRAATELREAAATATERLGEIIGVLRDGDAEAPVIPSQETVGELVDRAAASGLAVRLVQEFSGELSPMVDRAIHRVVQESLTNASKHAPGAEVTVTVSYLDDHVLVRIVDTGATRPLPTAIPSTGRGLAGLTERVRLVGGTLTARPRATDGGGFEVSARIPRTGGRPEPEVPAESATADERATVRRNARRGLITVIAAPVLLGGVVGVVALGYYLLVGYNSILRPSEYEQVRLGQSVAEVEALLPAMQMLDAPSDRLPAADSWSCHYYRPDAPFSTNYAYRLCFADGVLVAKDVVQTGSVEPTEEGTPR
ncbi:signal transduction histidine kinase [Kribbella orskensis]|uniref:histidine kinase n=1 Tax=Kribbella orskensis TaxID=2512216 RepID=A0ABY2BGE2_9ACTN|nr:MULTISPECIES: histidine kinase [Kribbella]TCN37904.1 signal transduction histidine kinase [Kribbella sp. VKM Ac-2500]TCO19390.1 signal transduction histidine kinase [Kribbella orskensis]